MKAEAHDEEGWRLDIDLAIADALKLFVQPHGEALRPLLEAAGALAEDGDVAG